MSSILTDAAPTGEREPLSEADALFLNWLSSNGAEFPKIEWPSNETQSGIRGAVAKEDISTDEHMIKIPAKLMMGPPHACADPVYGEIFQQETDILSGDLLVTVFVMVETLKRKDSFWFPFLNILPEAGNVTEWNPRQLSFLQDDEFIQRVRSRRAFIKMLYDRTITPLNARHPLLFPLESFTFALFKHAWLVIQARAFGRRLPWTALVPFADCLNHGNYQTKYDYNIENNDMFRLFPTGGNSYRAGCEAFNSYGRRANDNLLIDYGFAMLGNEWEEVQMQLDLFNGEENYTKKFRILFSLGMGAHRRVSFSMCYFPFEALTFMRISCMTLAELEAFEAFQEACADENAEQQESLRLIAAENSMTAHMGDHRKQPDDHQQDALLVRQQRLSRQEQHRRKVQKHANSILDARSELRALLRIKRMLQSTISSWQTSYDYDDVLVKLLNVCCKSKSARYDVSDGRTATAAFRELSSMASEDEADELRINEEEFWEGEDIWRAISAIYYRMTRKQIINHFLKKVEGLIAWFRSDHVATVSTAGTASTKSFSVAGNNEAVATYAEDEKASTSYSSRAIHKEEAFETLQYLLYSNNRDNQPQDDVRDNEYAAQVKDYLFTARNATRWVSSVGEKRQLHSSCTSSSLSAVAPEGSISATVAVHGVISELLDEALLGEVGK